MGILLLEIPQDCWVILIKKIEEKLDVRKPQKWATKSAKFHP
jgi:hypothetical protein